MKIKLIAYIARKYNFRYVKSNGTDCRFFYIDKYEHGAGSISE